jgi:hypothetical protein
MEESKHITTFPYENHNCDQSHSNTKSSRLEANLDRAAYENEIKALKVLLKEEIQKAFDFKKTIDNVGFSHSLDSPGARISY